MMKTSVDHKNIKSHEEYFNHMQTITLKANLYRRFYLYPKLVKFLPNKTLDIGCGLGSFQNFKKNVIGIDINSYCVNYCKSLGHQSFLYKQPPYNFTDCSFDSVLIDNVIEHILDPTNIIQEIYRILTPKGLCVVGVPGKKGFSAHADHKVFYEEKLLKDLMENNGFSTVKLFYAPFKSDYFNKNLGAYCLYGVFKK
jgi:SAM-dependent methyltransferase